MLLQRATRLSVAGRAPRPQSLQKRAELPVISATRLKKARLRGALMRQSTGTL
jgi:hypothetical protein